MTTDTARTLIADIAIADAAFEAWKADSFLSSSATISEYHAWAARRDEALAAVRIAFENAHGLVCLKCQGRGRLSNYAHRSGGLCYTCGGDGFTAKGRRQYATAAR